MNSRLWQRQRRNCKSIAISLAILINKKTDKVGWLCVVSGQPRSPYNHIVRSSPLPTHLLGMCRLSCHHQREYQYIMSLSPMEQWGKPSQQSNQSEPRSNNELTPNRIAVSTMPVSLASLLPPYSLKKCWNHNYTLLWITRRLSWHTCALLVGKG